MALPHFLVKLQRDGRKPYGIDVNYRPEGDPWYETRFMATLFHQSTICECLLV